MATGGGLAVEVPGSIARTGTGLSGWIILLDLDLARLPPRSVVGTNVVDAGKPLEMACAIRRL